jgi:hypothetical protein
MFNGKLARYIIAIAVTLLVMAIHLLLKLLYAEFSQSLFRVSDSFYKLTPAYEGERNHLRRNKVLSAREHE